MTKELTSAKLIRELHRECFLASEKDKKYIMVEWQKVRMLLDALDRAERQALARKGK